MLHANMFHCPDGNKKRTSWHFLSVCGLKAASFGWVAVVNCVVFSGFLRLSRFWICRLNLAQLKITPIWSLKRHCSLFTDC